VIALPAVDPLLTKELRGLSRRWQTYAGRVVYVGLAGLLLVLVWASSNFADGASPSELAMIGRRLFGWFVLLQVVLMTASAVMGGSDMICGEARTGTLGLLLLSGLSPRSIAWAKWKAAMAQTGALFLSGLPVLAACFYLGGVGVWSLAWSTAVALGMAALGAAFALRASAVAPTPSRAALSAFTALGTYCVLPILVFPLLVVAPFFHPLCAAFMAEDLDGGLYRYAWISATAVTFILVAGFVRDAGRRISKRTLDEPPEDNRGQDAVTLGGWYGISRLRPREGTGRVGVWDSRPLLWKELVTRPAARMNPAYRVVAFVFFLALGMLCWLLTLGRSPETFCFLQAFFLCVAVAVGSSLFAREISDRRIEMLLASPVSSARIVGAKLVAGLVSPEGLPALAAWVVSVPAFAWWAGLRGMVVYFAVSGLFLAFAYALSAAASLLAKTMRGAALLALGVLGIVLAGFPLLSSVLLPPYPASDSMGPLLILHPVSMISEGPGAAGYLPGFAGFYATATALLGLALPRLFDRATGRWA
jgi:ABC-type Na+ efflux pump permease subunit